MTKLSYIVVIVQRGRLRFTDNSNLSEFEPQPSGDLDQRLSII